MFFIKLCLTLLMIPMNYVAKTWEYKVCFKFYTAHNELHLLFLLTLDFYLFIYLFPAHQSDLNCSERHAIRITNPKA